MQTSMRPRRMAASREDDDAYLDSDIGYPNRRAQYRGHLALIFLLLVFGAVALVGGVMQNADEIAKAFPTAAALTQGAAWSRFFDGLGRMTLLGLIVVVAALFCRWRIRRARRLSSR